MPKQPQAKSTHLQELEAVFDRRTRRFSPFAVLGLNRPEKEDVDAQVESVAPKSGDPPTHPHVGTTHPHVGTTHPPTGEWVGEQKSAESLDFSGELTHPPTGEWVGGWVGTTHPRVVVVKNTTTEDPKTTHPPTHPPTPSKRIGQKKPRTAIRM